MGRPDPPPRGRPATLSLDRIVAAAVEVADELSRTEGLDALSMRSIATRLGVGTMSLYRYVPGKSELLDLMLDHVVDFPEEAAQPDGRTWREILTADARYHWRLCLDHPWYPFVDQSGRSSARTACAASTGSCACCARSGSPTGR